MPKASATGIQTAQKNKLFFLYVLTMSQVIQTQLLTNSSAKTSHPAQKVTGMCMKCFMNYAILNSEMILNSSEHHHDYHNVSWLCKNTRNHFGCVDISDSIVNRLWSG
jgi:hypothetical protein